MSRLVRWDPFRDLVSMRQQMDRLMDDWLAQSGEGGESAAGSFRRLALDVSENENAYMVRASVPGLQPEDLDINLQDNTLTIQGETRSESEREGEQWHLRERRFGRFQRSITLPNNVDVDKVDARYENGVLTLTLPKTEEAKPRKISVRSGGGGQTIEGTSSRS